jgi:hypothetical protein
VAVAGGRRVAKGTILSGGVELLGQVDTFAPSRKSAEVWLDDEGGTVVELRRVGELKSR